jgi:hypothetical protein
VIEWRDLLRKESHEIARPPLPARRDEQLCGLQQQRLMGVCNMEAAGLKGDEFKRKRDTCLADGRKRQQEVMKACAA